MTVFKGYLLMAKKNVGTILMFFGIFAFLAMLVAESSNGGVQKGFTAEKLDILLVDEDQSDLSQIVTRYLSDKHHVTKAENDKAKLYEALYYEKDSTDMVIRIPKGMAENAGKSKKVIELTQGPGSFGGIYVEQQISQLVAGILNYQNAGYTMEEAYKTISKAPGAEVSIMKENTGTSSKYSGFFCCAPYMFLAGLGSGVAMILFTFRRKQVKNRMMASSVSLTRQNTEAVLAVFLVGILLYGLTLLLAVARYGTAFLESGNLPYYLLNLFIDMLLALAMAFLVGMLVKKETAVNMIFTSLSLAFSFMGGVFVPVEYLSEGMRTVAKVIPVYWYEVVNDLLKSSSEISGSIRTQIWQAYGMQMLFVVAIFAVGLVIAKRKQQES